MPDRFPRGCVFSPGAGASRARLIRQALTEPLALSLCGGIAGCLFAVLLLRAFIAIAPDGMPFLSNARIDLRILIFALGASLACAIFFGVVTGIRKAGAELLAGRSRAAAPHVRLRRWLVMAQISASMVLLAGGALLARSFWNIENQNLGMNAENIITASISLGENGYQTAQSRMAFFRQLEGNLRYGPGVESLAISDSLPPGGYHDDHVYATSRVEGRAAFAGGTGGRVASRLVTPRLGTKLNGQSAWSEFRVHAAREDRAE